MDNILVVTTEYSQIKSVVEYTECKIEFFVTKCSREFVLDIIVSVIKAELRIKLLTVIAPMVFKLLSYHNFSQTFI